MVALPADAESPPRPTKASWYAPAHLRFIGFAIPHDRASHVRLHANVDAHSTAPPLSGAFSLVVPCCAAPCARRSDGCGSRRPIGGRLQRGEAHRARHPRRGQDWSPRRRAFVHHTKWCMAKLHVESLVSNLGHDVQGIYRRGGSRMSARLTAPPPRPEHARHRARSCVHR